MTDLLSLKYIPISQAELFESNAKLHNLDQIIQSIARYGFKSACKWESTLNDGRGGIVAGNGRVEALREMERRGDDLPIGIAQNETGEWCVPVLFGVEAESEAIARAYALDDNNLTLLGGDFGVEDLMKLYDQELLLSELEELSQYDEVPVSIGEANLEELLNQLISGKNDEPEPKYGEDDSTVPESIAVREGVEIGSIWALGRHRIMCSDSTVEANVRELLGERFNDVEMIWSDPPFNTKQQQGRTASQWGIIENDNLSDLEFTAFIKSFSDIIYKINPKSFYICCNWKSYPLFFPLFPAINTVIVWVKNNFGLGSGYRPQHELIMFKGRIDSNSESNVWNIRKDSGSDYNHPMQKPTELIEKALANSSQIDSIIFDPFLGSSPSIIAAQKLQGTRTIYGMELSPDYIEVILQRWEKFTGIAAKRIN
jgi:hypothetical protein